VLSSDATPFSVKMPAAMIAWIFCEDFGIV
jgi:hypothetical protein